MNTSMGTSTSTYIVQVNLANFDTSSGLAILSSLLTESSGIYTTEINKSKAAFSVYIYPINVCFELKEYES